MSNPIGSNVIDPFAFFSLLVIKGFSVFTSKKNRCAKSEFLCVQKHAWLKPKFDGNNCGLKLLKIRALHPKKTHKIQLFLVVFQKMIEPVDEFFL